MNMCDFQDRERYTIIADGCQCGVCCRGNPCGRCSEVMFPIYRTEKPNKEFLQKDGLIARRFNGCLKSTFTDADNFEIFFPIDCSPEDKMIMIGTALMIDYRYFNEDSDDGNNERVVNI